MTFLTGFSSCLNQSGRNKSTSLKKKKNEKKGEKLVVNFLCGFPPRATHHATTKLSWMACWASRRPGSRTVRKSCSNSVASLSRRTYSLWVRCSLRQAFWHLSRTSSTFRPPRPAATGSNVVCFKEGIPFHFTRRRSETQDT